MLYLFRLILAIVLVPRLFSESHEKKTGLILVVSSHNETVYSSHKDSWRRYMHAFEKDFESYFIEFDPHLQQPYTLEGDTLKMRGEESIVPGVLDKTLLALKYFENRFDQFEFVIRPYVSSFLVYPRLKKYLKRQQKEKFYGGHPLFFPDYEGIKGNHLNYSSGACPIFSIDLAKYLVSYAEFYIGVPDSKYNADDLLLAKAIKETGGILTPFKSCFIEKFASPFRIVPSTSKEIFHFRIKLVQNIRHILERKVHRELYEIFYE